jgi:hypothetical protein
MLGGDSGSSKSCKPFESGGPFKALSRLKNPGSLMHVKAGLPED